MTGQSTARLLIFGLGYCGSAVADAARAAGFAVTGTSRLAATTDADRRGAALDTIPFDAAASALTNATHLLCTVPPATLGSTQSVAGGDPVGDRVGDPDRDQVRAPVGAPVRDPVRDPMGDPVGDPVLARYAGAIAAAPHLRWIGYLSSTVVYGDRDGAWVDEDTPPAPTQERGHRRLAAEAAWSAFATTRAVDVFRLAGIYGPGRSVFDDLRAGRARRILRPGHAFGRIHRDDIAAAVLVAMQQDRAPGPRVLNLSDDTPAETAAVIEEAAHLLHVPPPPAVAFADAAPAMSPMARSIWAENRKVVSRKTRTLLGYTWRYPSYREGLRAILREEGTHGPA